MEKKTVLRFCRLVTVAMAIIIWCFTLGPAHSQFQPQPEPPGYEAYFGSLMINPGQDMLVHVGVYTPTKPIKVQVLFVGDGGDIYAAEPLDINPKETATVSLRDTLSMYTLPASTGPELFRVIVKAIGARSGAVVPTIQLAEPLDQPLPFVLYPIYLPWLHPQEGSQPQR